LFENVDNPVDKYADDALWPVIPACESGILWARETFLHFRRKNLLQLRISIRKQPLTGGAEARLGRLAERLVGKNQRYCWAGAP
jgi:hypothetical protein